MSGKSANDYEKDYTKPKLRERLKQKIKDSSKGGRKGQWSARKSQLLTQEYEKEGGDYKNGGKRTKSQKNLKKWTNEEWQTKSGAARARHGKTTDRYLPKKAWEKLSPEERSKTDRRKKQGSRKGKQHVANTSKAKQARRAAKSENATKEELYEQAQRMDLPRRSKMTKKQLESAIAKAK